MGLAKYWEVWKITWSNSIAYKFDFIAHALFIAMVVFSFIFLWKAVYGETTTLIQGYTITMMVWYLVLAESIVTGPGHFIEEIGDEIQSGNIAQHLNKPYNYIAFKYISTLSKTIIRGMVTFAIAGAVAFVFLGGLQLSWSALPLIVLLIFLALALHLIIMAIVGILAFWIEDSFSLYFVYHKFVFVLGGMFVPLEIYPGWLEMISKNLPFSYIAYYPAKMFVQFSSSAFWSILGHQIAWIGIMMGALILLYQLCIRKISINGG